MSEGYIAQARLAEAKAKLNQKRLDQIDQMLTAAGVPEWVVDPIDATVPSNAQPDRLRWYLARRKDVKPSERKYEEQIGRDMREIESYVAKYDL